MRMGYEEFWVYMLLCSDRSYYIGHTEDLEARLAAHQRGTLAGYTLSRRPVELIWAEPFTDRENAIARERQVKQWSRAKKAALAAQAWPRLVELSRARGSTGSPRTDREGGPPYDEYGDAS